MNICQNYTSVDPQNHFGYFGCFQMALNDSNRNKVRLNLHWLRDRIPHGIQDWLRDWIPHGTQD